LEVTNSPFLIKVIDQIKVSLSFLKKKEKLLFDQ